MFPFLELRIILARLLPLSLHTTLTLSSCVAHRAVQKCPVHVLGHSTCEPWLTTRTILSLDAGHWYPGIFQVLPEYCTIFRILRCNSIIIFMYCRVLRKMSNCAHPPPPPPLHHHQLWPTQPQGLSCFKLMPASH